jgi:hypothetical protein
MTYEMLGSCKIKLFDKSGKMIELEGSYGIDNGIASLHFKEGDLPPDFKPHRIEVKPITLSS